MAKEPKSLTTRQQIAIDDLVDNPRNPRLHTALQLNRLADSVRRFGQPRPILVRAENRMIIAGHGVREACRKAGLTQVDVLLWDVDQRTADAFMLADNRFGDLSAHDQERVAELLKEINEEDYLSVGFDFDEVQELLDKLEGDEIKVHEVDTELVADEFWINIRGPLADQAKALKRLTMAMDDLPEVTVELGTTPG